MPTPNVCGGQVTPGGEPFHAQQDFPLEPVLRWAKTVKWCVPALPQPARLGPMLIGRHDEQPKIGLFLA